MPFRSLLLVLFVLFYCVYLVNASNMSHMRQSELLVQRNSELVCRNIELESKVWHQTLRNEGLNRLIREQQDLICILRQRLYEGADLRRQLTAKYNETDSLKSTISELHQQRLSADRILASHLHRDCMNMIQSSLNLTFVS